jgi:hypothetical protein
LEHVLARSLVVVHLECDVRAGEQSPSDAEGKRPTDTTGAENGPVR